MRKSMSQYSARGRPWNRTKEAVIKRDGGVCYYCLGPANSADHIIPRSLIMKQGGTAQEADRMENLVACCMQCNRRKSNRVKGPDKTYINARWFR